MQTLVGEYCADCIILPEYLFLPKSNRELLDRKTTINAVLRSMPKLPKFNFFREIVELNIRAKNNSKKSVQFLRIGGGDSIFRCLLSSPFLFLKLSIVLSDCNN